MKKQLVLVEAVSMFRMRYVIEVPEGEEKVAWALDTVTLNEATEFSQLHLGETITSHRVISKEEMIEIFDTDNDYLKDWSEQRKEQFITPWREDESV